MPGFHHPVAGAFCRNCQTVELAGKTNGEIADIDHFLHFAQTFRGDLAGFNRDEFAEIGFAGAEFFAKQADQFAATRCWHQTPCQESGMGRVNCRNRFNCRCGFDICDLFTRHGCEGRHVATGIKRFLNTQTLQQIVCFLNDGHNHVPNFDFPPD